MITLDGKTLEELGLVALKAHQNPILPVTQDLTVDIPGVHGVYSFPSKLGPRSFSIPVLIANQNRNRVQSVARKLAAFLLDSYGRPRELKLVFDYEPDKYYKVKYSGQMDIERYVRLGNFVLPLVAHDPQAYFLYTANEITWDKDIPILSDISWGTGGAHNYRVTGNTTIQLINDGSLVVRPTFIIEGSALSITFEMNGKSFNMRSLNGSYEINGEKYTVLKDGANNYSEKRGKDWLELMPGTNELIITGAVLNINLTIDYRYKYM